MEQILKTAGHWPVMVDKTSILTSFQSQRCPVHSQDIQAHHTMSDQHGFTMMANPDRENVQEGILVPYG